MNFRIRLEDRIVGLREKLERDDFDFSQDDFKIFSESKEMRVFFIQKIKEHLSNWTPKNIAKILFEFFSNVDDMDLMDAEIITLMSHYDIDQGNLSDIDSYFPMLENPDDLLNYLKEKLKDPSYHAKKKARGETITPLCIEQGRIDLVSMNQKISHLSERAIEKIATEYDFPISSEQFGDAEAILTIRQSNDDYLTFQEYMEKYPEDMERLKKEYYSPKRSIRGTTEGSFRTLYSNISEEEKERFLIRTLEGGLYTFFLDYAPKTLIQKEQDTITRKIQEGVIDVSYVVGDDSILLENPEYVKFPTF